MTLDLTSLGQELSGPTSLVDEVSTVSHTLSVPRIISVQAHSLYTAISNSSNTCPQLTRNSILEYTSSQHQLTSFRMSADDINEQLVLRGTLDADVPIILTQFRKRVELTRNIHVLSEETNKRGVRFLPLLLKHVALETYSQLTLGTLEWRSENPLAELRVRQINVAPVAP